MRVYVTFDKERVLLGDGDTRRYGVFLQLDLWEYDEVPLSDIRPSRFYYMYYQSSTGEALETP